MLAHMDGETFTVILFSIPMTAMLGVIVSNAWDLFRGGRAGRRQLKSASCQNGKVTLNY